MSPEEKAKIARENGAKSRGPVTPEGKTRSSRNAIKSGNRTEKHQNFLPPHSALLCNEDRQAFFQLMDTQIATYQPANLVAAAIVRDIAVALWHIQRLQTLTTFAWDLELLAQSQSPLTVAEEYGDMQTMSRAGETLYKGKSSVETYENRIDKLHLRITRLERRLKFVHANYATTVPGRTQHEPTQPVENTTHDPENSEPVYVTENTPEVIAYYQQHFPGRQIIVLPPDDVANGIDTPDHLPDLPRKAM